MTEPPADVRFPVIDLPAEADSPEAAVRFLLGELVRAGSLLVAAAVEAEREVGQRERLGSTAIGHGLALPHARVRAMARPVGIIGRCARLLEWPGALDGRPVRWVGLLLVPGDSADSGCRAWEPLLRQLRGGEANKRPREF